jgi:hypothetical protein
MAYSVYYTNMRRTATSLELDWALVDDASLPTPDPQEYLATGTVSRDATSADDADGTAIANTVLAVLQLAIDAAQLAKAAYLVGQALDDNIGESNSLV